MMTAVCVPGSMSLIGWYNITTWGAVSFLPTYKLYDGSTPFDEFTKNFRTWTGPTEHDPSVERPEPQPPTLEERLTSFKKEKCTSSGL